ncbi:cysteine hydrolase [Diaphorobacter sp. JS3050]|uniref:cysteine hydrolase family protein n=1 Tax=unclassified Diaphorobacter TaxID=2649760 RepID=UPI001554A961|nr:MULTISPECIES: isochorismatase family cysteine hydrolase [unclassified Diaphorobacter]QJY32518.1 cysteine hydrolase [Diaphorobacter sp. JS3050]QPN30485.1 cysteine hydrolase [Diaphorobacter sp. JS3051]
MARPAALRRTPLPRSKHVLLLVDVINPLNFSTAADLLPGAVRAANAIARLKTRLARRGVTAIYANDNYGTWHSDFRDILTACLLAPAPQDLVILKPQHSAFHSTPLQHLLDKMQTEQLIIVGLAADMCVMLTATDARMLGYKVWVPSDCTAAESEHRKTGALRQLHEVFKCAVRPAVRAAAR